MEDFIERTERDRALFKRGMRDQLQSLIVNGDQRKLTRVIIKLLQTQVAYEEFARERGVDFESEAMSEFVARRGDLIQEQTDRAINQFIGSVYSQEG